MLGAKVKVPTPDGPVMLTIPKGTSSGKVLRLKGRGFTAKDGKRGDQLVDARGRRARGRRRAAAIRRELERRRQPARGPRRLAPSAECATFPPNRPKPRRKRLASMRAAFGTEVEEKLKPRLTPWEVVKRVADRRL